MKISKILFIQVGLFTLIVTGLLLRTIATIGYEKTSAFGVALIQSSAQWREYTLLKYEIFCQGSDGSILVKTANPEKLFRFKAVALASQDTELLLPFSDENKLKDIQSHLNIFDDETAYHLTSLDNDHQPFQEKKVCNPVNQNPKPSDGTPTRIARNEGLFQHGG